MEHIQLSGFWQVVDLIKYWVLFATHRKNAILVKYSAKVLRSSNFNCFSLPSSLNETEVHIIARIKAINFFQPLTITVPINAIIYTISTLHQNSYLLFYTDRKACMYVGSQRTSAARKNRSPTRLSFVSPLSCFPWRAIPPVHCRHFSGRSHIIFISLHVSLLLIIV